MENFDYWDIEFCSNKAREIDNVCFKRFKDSSMQIYEIPIVEVSPSMMIELEEYILFYLQRQARLLWQSSSAG